LRQGNYPVIHEKISPAAGEVPSIPVQRKKKRYLAAGRGSILAYHGEIVLRRNARAFLQIGQKKNLRRDRDRPSNDTKGR